MGFSSFYLFKLVACFCCRHLERTLENACLIPTSHFIPALFLSPIRIALATPGLATVVRRVCDGRRAASREWRPSQAEVSNTSLWPGRLLLRSENAQFVGQCLPSPPFLYSTALQSLNGAKELVSTTKNTIVTIELCISNDIKHVS